ncbi:MAG: serine/threonine protein kinase, partial [Myxococcales bacterium]|nr:serine/threonine protein kinase [Myxococcales bacterium]
MATLRGAAGRLLDDATEVGDRTLLGPPQVDDQATLLEDQLRFEDGRILHQGGARPTETLGSFGSTMPDAEAASDEEAAALLAATAVAMPSIRPTRALLEPGDQVEGYRIEREIGRGGMGRVYAAEHGVTGQKVALKMLLPQLLGDARLKARFINEAKVLARLEHPSLVQLLGFIDTPRAAFIVMPFVAGSTLDKVIQRHGQLPIEMAVGLFAQMCEGLDHMHQHAVMHRDLKPSNVIIQDDDRVRITDFGIARSVGSQKLTMDGMVVG